MIIPSPLQARELIICLRRGRFDIRADAVMRILLEEVVQQGAAVSLPALILLDGQINQIDHLFMAHDEAESAEDTIVFERAQRITVILAQAEHL